MHSSHRSSVVMLSLVLLGGCSNQNAGGNAATSPPASTAPAQPTVASPAATAAADPVAEARSIYKRRCVVCHGESGSGDGAGAAALTPKPRAFGDASWQAGITDETLLKSILEGGAAVGKSAAMPANPDLMDKPAVTRELVKIIRAFGPAK